MSMILSSRFVYLRKFAGCISAYSTQAKKKLDVSGVYIPTVVPFTENEDIDWNKFQENVSKWNKIPFRGYVTGGSNGEFPFMTDEERIENVKKMRNYTPTDKLIIAGSGCESTRNTIKMTKAMADVGADAALVVTPSYFKGKMTAEALIKHYMKVADASPVPVILYSVPANTGIDIPAEVIIKLSHHDNIIGVKDSGGDVTKLGYLVHKTQQYGFQVLAGSAGHALAACSVGCVGGVYALANTLGSHVCDLHRLINEGNLDVARNLQYRLIAPNTALTKDFGVAAVKQSMEWFGLHGGHPRLPLLPLDKTNVDKLRSIFISEGFLS